MFSYFPFPIYQEVVPCIFQGVCSAAFCGSIEGDCDPGKAELFFRQHDGYYLSERRRGGCRSGVGNTIIIITNHIFPSLFKAIAPSGHPGAHIPQSGCCLRQTSAKEQLWSTFNTSRKRFQVALNLLSSKSIILRFYTLQRYKNEKRQTR